VRVVQRAGHAGRAGITRRLHVRGTAGEENAVDTLEDFGDVERRLEHRDQHRQAVRGLDNGRNVFLADGMKRMRPDHASI